MDEVEAAKAARFNRHLAVIVAVAFALRLAARLVRGAADFWSEGYTAYALLARELAAGHGYGFPGQGPTAFRVPFYPLFLTATGGGSGGFFTVALAQSAVSAGTVALAGLLSRDRFGPRAGLWAAAIAAIYPYFVVHDTALQESGLFACLAALATWLLWRLGRRPSTGLALVTGAALGLALLTRATLLPFALLALGWLVWRGRALAAVVVLAASLAVLSPWLGWSYALTGRASLGTEAGQSLWGGNNPRTFDDYPERSIDLSRAAAWAALAQAQRDALLRLSEDERDDRLWGMGVAWIAAHPADAALGATRKLGAAFGPLPSPRKGTMATAVYLLSYGPVLLLGLLGLWRERRRWRHDALIHAHFAAFAAVTALFWAHTSHRAYLDVYLIVFAAGWLAGRAQAAGWRRRASAAASDEDDD